MLLLLLLLLLLLCCMDLFTSMFLGKRHDFFNSYEPIEYDLLCDAVTPCDIVAIQPAGPATWTTHGYPAVEAVGCMPQDDRDPHHHDA